MKDSLQGEKEFSRKSGNPINVIGQIYTKLHRSKLLAYLAREFKAKHKSLQKRGKEASRVLMGLLQIPGFKKVVLKHIKAVTKKNCHGIYSKSRSYGTFSFCFLII